MKTASYDLKFPSQISAFSEIIDLYDVFFIDLWGVTHNGKAPFPGALDCFAQIKKANKKIYLLSNAPRMPEIAISRLTEMGVARNLYETIHTSGLECHLHLRDRLDDFYRSLGTKLIHIGPERDRNLFETLDYDAVSNIDQADFMLVTGTDQWDDTLADYEPILQVAHQRQMPLVCANADKRVMIGDEVAICSGAIAARYQEMGGRVRSHGKPSTTVYKTLHEMANQDAGLTVQPGRILMIGDSLATDITGADAYGIDSLFVLSGIHGGDLLPYRNDEALFQEKVTTLIKTYGAAPTYLSNALA
ncbi:MAG: TIGR01459 family HAD-type hydrolase [Alphaproteobacteria bacterium]|nr:TIGR01459 family HAD-type hydrolase [Alphaproteobacteria bacterium]